MHPENLASALENLGITNNYDLASQINNPYF